MSVGSRLRAALKSLFGDSAIPNAAGGLLAGIFQSGQVPRRGTRELLQAYKRLPWLRTVTQRIAHDTASTPLVLYRAKRAGDAGKILRSFGGIRTKLVDRYAASGDLVPVDSHPFLDLIANMNPALPGHASLFVTQLYIDIKGETFWVLERNSAGQAVEAWPIPPHWMVQTPTKANPTFRASWGAWQKVFPEEDVLWIRSPDPEQPYGRGTGVAEALSDELDIDEYCAKHVKAWFANRALPETIVAVQGMHEDDLKRWAQKMEDQHRGVEKAHRPHVTNLPIQVQTLSQTFQEQDLTNLRQSERDAILQVFNMPPECAGIIENSNRATIDASYYLYSQGVLCPRLDFLAASLQPLVDEWDESLILGYESPVPDDKDFKQKVMAAVPSVFTLDEHRALAGEEPLPDGEGEVLFEPAVAQGFAPMGQGGQPPPDAPPAGKALPRRKDLTLSQIESALTGLLPERLSSELSPVWESKMRKWGNRVLRELGTDASFNMRNPLIRSHLEHLAGQKITGINETTRSALMESLADGVYAGEGISQLQSRVSDVFDYADKVRSRMIARTEVVGSSNFANVEAFAQSGVVAKKEWLAVKDGATRDTHRELDGQVVILRAPFSANGQSAQYPGGFGVAEEDIGCRCAVLPVVATESVKLTEEQRVEAWKRYDRRLESWESSAAAALRRGFRAQEREIQSALEALRR